jgi:hypothetical protein
MAAVEGVSPQCHFLTIKAFHRGHYWPRSPIHASPKRRSTVALARLLESTYQ